MKASGKATAEHGRSAAAHADKPSRALSRGNGKGNAPNREAVKAAGPGMKVLDVGCGDGTTALPEAKLGADVLGVDIARNLVDAGNAHAQARG